VPKFTPATFDERAYNCPYCGVYAKQHWWVVGYSSNNDMPNKNGVRKNSYFSCAGYTLYGVLLEGLNISVCGHCDEHALWLGERMILPPNSNVEPPHDDMPEAV
jgi:hypothetical protein